MSPLATGRLPRVGVVGATGYVGSEVVRWLLGRVELSVYSSGRAGEPLSAAVPALYGFSDLVLQPIDPEALSGLDVVMIATPHGVARDLAPRILAPRILAPRILAPRIDAPLIVDLSADHRHAPGWVYGLPEWNAEAIAGAPRVAAPGCFATAMALSLAPLVAAGVVTGPACVNALTGSAGSGATPKQASHHAERFANTRAYKVLDHQHVPEVRGFLAGLGEAPDLHFVPLSAPLDRGIFATTFVPVRDVDLAALFADAYGSAPYVRIRSETPEVRHVRGTALCDIAVHRAGDHAVVLAAIDNLGKGAAGQAVQCLEIALGLQPGTRSAPCTP